MEPKHTPVGKEDTSTQTTLIFGGSSRPFSG